MNDAAPPRRWSLRTLFVVMTVGGILGWWVRWNVIQVRERKELVAYLRGLDHQPNPVQQWVLRWDNDNDRIPTVWRWLGASNEDWGTELLCNDALTYERLKRAEQLLPDCKIDAFYEHRGTPKRRK